MSTQAAELFEEMFKFKIGDVVRLVGSDRDVVGTRRFLDHETPCRFVVVEQWLQRCHGGFQQSYSCRTCTPGGNTMDKPFLFVAPLLELAGRWNSEELGEKKA